MALPKLQSKKAILAMGVAAIQSMKDTERLVHESALQAIMHAEKHGDVEAIGTLIDAMRNWHGKRAHANVTGLTAWLRDYTPVYRKPNGNWGLRSKDDEKYVPFNLEAANDNPFWTHKAQPQGVDQFTVADVIKLVTETPQKKLARAIENGEVAFTGNTLDKVRRALKASADAFTRVMGADGEIKVNADLAPDAKPAKAAV